LCSLAKFDLANWGVPQLVQRHTFNAQLLVFDVTLVQPYFAVENCSGVEMIVFHSPVLTRSLIFLQLWTAGIDIGILPLFADNLQCIVSIKRM